MSRANSITLRREAEKLARDALGALPPYLIDAVLQRAIGKPIVIWTCATRAELTKIYAYARSAALVFLEGPES